MTRYLILTALPLLIGACTNAASNDTAAADAPGVANEAATNSLPADGNVTAGGAAASLAAADGAARGSSTVSEGAGGLTVQVNVENLPAGEHGLHIHMVGRCDPPKFETAGGHWNPANKQHGRDNPKGAHGGDMPNLTVGADGRGTATLTLAGETLSGLLDADGAALVVHADPDDYRTDPSGNSGDRIACGVIARS